MIKNDLYNTLVEQLSEPLRTKVVALLSDSTIPPNQTRQRACDFLLNRLEQLPILTNFDQELVERLLKELTRS